MNEFTSFKVLNTFSDSGSTDMAVGYKAVNQSLTNLLCTALGELLGSPNFGVQLLTNAYALNNEYVKNILYNDLISQVAKYDRRVKVRSLDIEQQEATMNIIINYSLLNEEYTFNYTIGVD